MSDERELQRGEAPPVQSFLLPENHPFPNNGQLVAILYRTAVALDRGDPAGSMETHFARNGWGYAWRNGIFPYDHYHSTAHEVLGIAAGWAQVRLGGEGEIGVEIEMRAGDVLVIPAGVALKNLGSSQDLVAVGAYPPGQVWDVNTGEDDERPRTDGNIANLPLPKTDPVSGVRGPLIDFWLSARAGSR